MSTSVLSIIPENHLHFNRLERCIDEKNVLNQSQIKPQSTNNGTSESRENCSIADTNLTNFEMRSDEDHHMSTDCQEYKNLHTDNSHENVNGLEKKFNVETSDELCVEHELTNPISTKTPNELILYTQKPFNINSSNTFIKIPHKGISNLGNTCYLASALQMLLSVEGFVKEIIQSFRQQEGHSNCPLRDALATLFISSYEQDVKSSNPKHLDPTDLKKAMDDISTLFDGYLQQDAHEFLSTLLDILHDEFSMKEDVSNVNCDDKEIIHESNDEMRDCSAHSLRTSEDERFFSDNDFVLVNIHEESVEKLESDTKKARLATNLPSLSKTPSYSELNFDGINSLLHGNTPKSQNQSSTISSNCDHLKLVGGQLISESSFTQKNQLGTFCDSSTFLEDKPLSQCNQSLCTGNPVDKYFAMEVQTHLTCDSCSYRSSHLEIYRHLSIDVGNDEDDQLCETSVIESLRSFFAPEKRHLKCEKCFSETATQTTTITKVPNALILHLKRFIVDIDHHYASISYKKNLAPIDFPEKLDLDREKENSILAEFLTTDVSYPEMGYTTSEEESQEDSEESITNSFVKVPKGQYHIRSIVNHIGSNVMCGHYTTDALRMYPSDQNTENHISSIRKWTRFNDDFVSLVNHHEAMGINAQKSAYMLLYEFE
jgi:ubiquitin C-terminal hydrolase